MRTVHVTHFSDILCVWAYVSQVRIDELVATFGAEVVIDTRYVDVFGDARGKLEAGWKQRGGLSGYADHVQQVADRFDHAPVNQEVWRRVAPHSSMPAHLILGAARATGIADAQVRDLAWRIRVAFFQDARDVSVQPELLALCRDADVDVSAIEGALASGTAHAQLASDLTVAKEAQIRVSPSFIFNERRQVLNGNVGYRVIEANVRELLREPAEEQSWC